MKNILLKKICWRDTESPLFALLKSSLGAIQQCFAAFSLYSVCPSPPLSFSSIFIFAHSDDGLHQIAPILISSTPKPSSFVSQYSFKYPIQTYHSLTFIMATKILPFIPPEIFWVYLHQLLAMPIFFPYFRHKCQFLPQFFSHFFFFVGIQQYKKVLGQHLREHPTSINWQTMRFFTDFGRVPSFHLGIPGLGQGSETIAPIVCGCGAKGLVGKRLGRKYLQNTKKQNVLGAHNWPGKYAPKRGA